MGTTYYYTVNEEIIGEHTIGQSRLDYIPDALGSVVATVDQTLTVKSTARFKPYGADLATTGTQPMYGWVGVSGSYRKTGRPHTDFYMQQRHFGSNDGIWTSVDPIWPQTPPFVYAYGSPTLIIDQSGLEGTGTLPRPTTPTASPTPPRGFPVEPSPVSPRCPIPPISPMQGCIILMGLEACRELCTYQPGHPTGPFTGLGDCIGQALFPGTNYSPAPAPIHKPPKRRPPRQGCHNMCDAPCYRMDRVPPSRPHKPCPGDHIVYMIYEQAPDCTCYPKWSPIYCWPQGAPDPQGIPKCPKQKGR